MNLPALQWDAKEALMWWSQKKKRLETLLEKAKVGFSPHFSSDLLDSLSYLLVKPGGKHSQKTLLRNCIESTQRYFGQVVFYLTFDYNSIDFDIYEERLQHNWKYLQVELAVGLALTLLLAKTRFQLSTFMLKWHLWQHLT